MPVADQRGKIAMFAIPAWRGESSRAE